MRLDFSTLYTCVLPISLHSICKSLGFPGSDLQTVHATLLRKKVLASDPLIPHFMSLSNI